MADVFVSYAREDRDRAARLAGALESHGWSVWWDRNLVAGQSFDQTIERELNHARSVVVLWSRLSLDKTWVRNEARRAAARGVLVPAMIDAVELPLEFSDKQAADLIGWEGETNHAGFQVLCNGIAMVLGTVPAPVRPQSPRPPVKRWRPWVWGAAMTVLVVVMAVGIYSVVGRQPEVPMGKGTLETEKKPEAGTALEPPRRDGELHKQAYDNLAAAQMQAVEKLIARKPGALAEVDRNLDDIAGAAAGFPDDADFQALLGYARKDAYQSTRRLVPEARRDEYLGLARRAFERALELDPKSAGARNGMGNVLYLECRFDEAIAWYDKALAVAPPNYRSIIEEDRRKAEAARSRKQTCPLPL